jgi:rhodanese-related sulfurtransferase
VLSPLAARKAAKLGYTNIKVFHAGIPAWKKAGHVMVSNEAGLDNLIKLDASYILIDLRPKSQVEQGHILKAIALPEGGIEVLKDQFPKHKAAPIILYNESGNLESAAPAAKKISSWGYSNVSILSGGLASWEKSGKALAKGPAPSQIQYVRKLLPGEIDVEFFRAAVEKPSGDVFIVDVRTSAEAEEAHLPGAKNIPLEELEQRIGELPKDKKIVVHCATGVRAEMAQDVLKKTGLNSGYVKAKVDFDEDLKGKYSITE